MRIRPQHIKELLSSQLTPEELALVYKYLRLHPEVLEDIFPEEEWLAEDEDPQLKNYDSKALLDDITQTIYEPKASLIQKIRPYYKWAGAAILLISIGILYQVFINKVNDNQIANTVNARHHNFGYVNNSNDYAIAQLNDGSVVKLAPGASIKYNVDYASANRDIHLDGNALFAVAHNTAMPFVVYSGNISTRAVGTIFSVDYSVIKNAVKVKLLEGKVLVKNNRLKADSTFMEPGDYCTINENRPIVHITTSKIDAKVSLKKNHNSGTEVDIKDALANIGNNRVIELKSQPVKAVVEIYKRLYHVSIEYKTITHNKKLENRYSGLIDLDKISIEQAIENLTVVNGLKWKKVDKDHFEITDN